MTREYVGKHRVAAPAYEWSDWHRGLGYVGKHRKEQLTQS